METVKIKKVTFKKNGTSNKNGGNRQWTLSEVILEDGRTVETFDTFKEGETCNVEMEAGQRGGFMMKRVKEGGGGRKAQGITPQPSDRRIEALKLAVATYQLLTPEQRKKYADEGKKMLEVIKATADSYLEYINETPK